MPLTSGMMMERWGALSFPKAPRVWREGLRATWLTWMRFVSLVSLGTTKEMVLCRSRVGGGLEGQHALHVSIAPEILEGAILGSLEGV